MAQVVPKAAVGVVVQVAEVENSGEPPCRQLLAVRRIGNPAAWSAGTASDVRWAAYHMVHRVRYMRPLRMGLELPILNLPGKQNTNLP